MKNLVLIFSTLMFVLGGLSYVLKRDNNQLVVKNGTKLGRSLRGLASVQSNDRKMYFIPLKNRQNRLPSSQTKSPQLDLVQDVELSL